MSRYLRTFWYLTLTTKSIQLFFFKMPQKPIKPIRAKMQPRAISIGVPMDRILVNVVLSTVFNTSDAFWVICAHIPYPAVMPPHNYSVWKRKSSLVCGLLTHYIPNYMYLQRGGWRRWKPALNILSPSCRCCLSVVEMSTRKVCQDKLLSSFTNHQIVPNLYECLSFVQHKWIFFFLL